jgi:hypothetical protein
MAFTSPRSLLCSATLLVAACGTRDPHASTANPPPPAEFLVATQDSTFWVRAERSGVRVRGAPLTLAKYGGRFYEIFLADDDRSYDDALLVGLRLYRRDLLDGDSTVVFEDSIVPRLAREYAHAHPGARPLGPDQDGAEDPPTQALADLEVVGVQGPYLSFEYHVDVTNRGADPWHATRRGVIDLRSGRSARVADLLPAKLAATVVDSGRRQLAAVIDSMRRESRGAAASAARRALAALSDSRFDERSFVLSVPDSQPAIEFALPQRGTDVPDDVFSLDPLLVRQAPWWPEIAANFPNAANDLDHWLRFEKSGYDLIARYDSSAETAGLSLSDHVREWPVRVIAAPILHVFWLDKPAIDSTQRRALSRAFDEASLYDEATRTVHDTHRRGAPARFASSSRHSPSPRAGSRRHT